MARDDNSYLLHIRDAIDRIFGYTSAGDGLFFTDRKTQDAVIRNLEIIGEAAKRLSDSTKEQPSTIPWSSLAGLRDVLAHQYFSVDLEMIWEVVAVELTPIREQIAEFLANAEPVDAA